MENNEELEVKRPLTAKEIMNGETTRKPISKIKDKVRGAAEKVLENARTNETLSKDEDYNEIDKENKEATRNGGWVSVLGPILGTVGGPLAAIFSLGLDDDKIQVLGAVLLGGLIGNLIGGLISYGNLKTIVANRTKMTWLFAMNKYNLLQQKNEAIVGLESLVEEQKTEIKDLELELMNFRIEKKAKELNNK